MFSHQIEVKQYVTDSKQQLTEIKQQMTDKIPMDLNTEMSKKMEAYIDRVKEQLGGEIEETVKKLQKQKEFIEFLEEQQAEL